MEQIHILLVEDNEGDIFLTTEALKEARIANKISVIRDGLEAIAFLDKKAPFENVVSPDLVLLDVNLPKKNGHEVLQYIKTNEMLKRIPVIMLTTSSSEHDIFRSYGSHANCFITKPVEVQAFFNVIAGIEDFWISIVKLPGKKIFNQ